MPNHDSEQVLSLPILIHLYLVDQSCPGQELGYPERDELEDGERRLDALGIVQQPEVLVYGITLVGKLLE